MHVVTNTIKRIYGYEIKKKYKKTQFDVKVLPVPVVSDRYIRNADICMASAWPTAFSVARLSPNKGKKYISFKTMKYGITKNLEENHIHNLYDIL